MEHYKKYWLVITTNKKAHDELIKNFFNFCSKCFENENWCFYILETSLEKLILLFSEKPINIECLINCLFEFKKNYPDLECEIAKSQLAFKQISSILDLCEFYKKTQNDKYYLLLEELITPRMTTSDIIKVFKEKLDKKLQCRLKDYLIITDPYFLNFSSHEIPFVKDLFSNIKRVNPKLGKLKLIIPKQNYEDRKKKALERILRNLGIELTVLLDEYNRGKGLFHDRFWIFHSEKLTDCCGLFVGTSLNGLAKKYALIEYLSEKDCVDIICEIKEKFRIY